MLWLPRSKYGGNAALAQKFIDADLELAQLMASAAATYIQGALGSMATSIVPVDMPVELLPAPPPDPNPPVIQDGVPEGMQPPQ
jgi:hypothetical protein